VARALSPAASALKPTLVFGLPTWVEMSLVSTRQAECLRHKSWNVL
jgi:hypothetical protein